MYVTYHGVQHEYAMTQLESQGLIHPDAHMFVQEDFYQAKSKDLISIMTQFSLKAVLKYWRDKAHPESKSGMKQLHLGNTSIPMHRSDLKYEELQMLLELHMLLK